MESERYIHHLSQRGGESMKLTAAAFFGVHIGHRYECYYKIIYGGRRYLTGYPPIGILPETYRVRRVMRLQEAQSDGIWRGGLGTEVQNNDVTLHFGAWYCCHMTDLSSNVSDAGKRYYNLHIR